MSDYTPCNIYCCDAFELLGGLEDGSVQTVVTSPPYNLRNSSGNGLKGENNKSLWTNQPMRYGYGIDGYTDDMPHDEYIAWQRRCLGEMMRVLRPDGAIFYNHKWRVQDGILQRLADDITRGFPVRQIIIWDRRGGFNFNSGYLVPTFEVIYLICKPDFRIAPTAKGMKDVWNFTPATGKAHPNAFPDELPRRCLMTVKDGLVLDPFAGIGTTLLTAQKMHRPFIGCDLNPEYVETAKQRLSLPFTADMFAQHEMEATHV